MMYLEWLDKSRLGVIALFLMPVYPGSSISAQDAPPSRSFTVFLGGDSIITQPWSDTVEHEFHSIVAMIRDSDVAIVNLETTIGNHEGFPQRDPGGSYLMARPQIADELVWAGIDMVSGANNHTFDYGSVGVLETLKHVQAAGLEIAGAGSDAQRAMEPALFDAGDRSVALISMTSTFHEYGMASPSRPDVHGRPGLNPLTVSVDGPFVRLLVYSQRNILDWFARTGVALRGIRLRRTDDSEIEANLEAVSRVKSQADFVVLSIHSHGPGVWIEDFAHQAIDAGVDVFFSHGPHSVSGIEIYNGRPVFYGLGNFVFQPEQVERVPAEAFERLGLRPEASREEYFQAKRIAEGRRQAKDRRELWEGAGAIVQFKQDSLVAVKVVPLDLGANRNVPRLGIPYLADSDLAKEIIARIADRSLRYGTEIRREESSGLGIVNLDRAPKN